MNYKSANTQQSRNTGIFILGLLAAFFFWHWVGAYSLIFSVLSGCVTYVNDVYYKNSPSKLDPLFSTLGGCVFIVFAVVVKHQW